MKTINQDMLAIERGVLFHQVNCRGVMGNGIARAFAQKFPGLENAYREYCETHRINLLGQVFVYKASDELYIINIFGQDGVSTRQRMTSYDATVRAFESFKHDFADLPLFFPYNMGCGLGGGNWQIYSAIIQTYFPQGIICKHTPG